MDDATLLFLESNPWVENGRFLRRLLQAPSEDSLVEILGCCAGLRYAIVSPAASRTLSGLAKVLEQIEPDDQFVLVATFLLNRTPDEIAVPQDSTPLRVEKSLKSTIGTCYASFSGDAPWRSALWIRLTLAEAPPAERSGFSSILRMLITLAEGIQSPADEDFPWVAFSSSGYSSRGYSGRSLPVSKGYALPDWLQTTLNSLPSNASLVAWQASLHGPIVIGRTKSLGHINTAASALLAWADAVLYDDSGPIAGIIWLRDELTRKELDARWLAGLLVGAMTPITILLVLPKSNSVAQGAWSSLVADDPLQLDESTIGLAGGPHAIDKDSFSPFQETWHVFGGVIDKVLVSLANNETAPGAGVWSRSVPTVEYENTVSWRVAAY